MAWSDYHNGDVDVFCASSTDHGRTWSKPVRVNTDPIHDGIDQFFQWMAVDPVTGEVYVQFYDRRDDPANRKTGFTLARSTDGGKTFVNYAWAESPFESEQPAFLGDYTWLTAYNRKVFGAWTEALPTADPPANAEHDVVPALRCVLALRISRTRVVSFRLRLPSSVNVVRLTPIGGSSPAMVIRKLKFHLACDRNFGRHGLGKAQQSDPAEEGQLRFRFVGPKVGNRIAAVAGVPGDASTYYAGAASGGVWKSTDGGNRWTPIFDKQPVAAIGALAVAPSDPSTVWAGTGEAWMIRDSDVMGNGIYKSTDAGKTWTNMGLQETGRIGRIVIHPSNPDIVFVCALGRTTGPQQERGVFRTIDGGQHWERVLFAGENVGCSGLSMDPHNPRTLFAGMWQVEMHTWGEFSGGPGSGIYVSRDGGTKWTRIEEHGLPHGAARQDRCRGCSNEFESCLCPDSDQRSGIALEIR